MILGVLCQTMHFWTLIGRDFHPDPDVRLGYTVTRHYLWTVGTVAVTMGEHRERWHRVRNAPTLSALCRTGDWFNAQPRLSSVNSSGRQPALTNTSTSVVANRFYTR
jgi:hypothetical protein